MIDFSELLRLLFCPASHPATRRLEVEELQLERPEAEEPRPAQPDPHPEELVEAPVAAVDPEASG